MHDRILLVVDNLLQFLGGVAQQVAELAGDRFQIPDVGHRNGQGDVAQALPANLFAGDFDTAAITDDAPIANPLVLTTMAFPILDGAENALAEQPILLRLVGAVVDGFRF